MFTASLKVKSQHDQRDVGKPVQESYDRVSGEATLLNGMATDQQHSTRVFTLLWVFPALKIGILVHIVLYCSSPNKSFDAEGPTDPQMMEK